MLLSLVGKLRLLNNLIRNNKTKAMKKLYILILLMGLSLNLFAERMRYYCEVKGIQKELSAGLKIVFDFGNNPVYSAWGGLKNKQKLVDKDGNEIPFNSMVDAGNYLSSKGWNFVQAYTSVYGSNAIVHWIFYKDADSPEEAVKGIVIKDEYNKAQKK